LIGGEDVAISALAGKFLAFDLEEFESFALDACRTFMPGLLEESDKEMNA